MEHGQTIKSHGNFASGGHQEITVHSPLAVSTQVLWLTVPKTCLKRLEYTVVLQKVTELPGDGFQSNLRTGVTGCDLVTYKQSWLKLRNGRFEILRFIIRPISTVKASKKKNPARCGEGCRKKGSKMKMKATDEGMKTSLNQLLLFKTLGFYL